MKLRTLELKDAKLMLEWMNDKDVIEYMKADFSGKNIIDCEEFILDSNSIKKHLHLAIVNDKDEYMGTVSLKNINIKNKSAEFAIILRTVAMGKGYSDFAMKEIIKIGFEEYKLDNIYWCVSDENVRAIRFYDRNGYNRISPEKLYDLNYSKKEIESYIWYLEQRKSHKL